MNYSLRALLTCICTIANVKGSKLVQTVDTNLPRGCRHYYKDLLKTSMKSDFQGIATVLREGGCVFPLYSRLLTGRS